MVIGPEWEPRLAFVRYRHCSASGGRWLSDGRTCRPLSPSIYLACDLEEVEEHGTRRTLSVIIYFSVAFSVLRVPFSDLLVTALRAPAGYYPAAGYRSGEGGGALTTVSTYGYIRSSEPSGSSGRALEFAASVTRVADNWTRRQGLSVRCLQAFTNACIRFPPP